MTSGQKKTAGLLVTLAVLGAVAVGGSALGLVWPKGAPTTPAAVSEPATQAPAPDPMPSVEVVGVTITESEGLAAIRAEFPEFQIASDEMLIGTAKKACSAFDAGLTLEGYAAIALDSGLTPEQAGGIAWLAISAYCPQHGHIIE